MTPNDAEKASVAESFLRKEFLNRLESRLEAGARDYGNASLERPFPETAEEILDELLDVAGWSYVAWVRMRTRLQRLEIAAREIETPLEDT